MAGKSLAKSNDAALAKLDNTALAAHITSLTVRAEKFRVAFNNSSNPTTGKRYRALCDQLGRARTAKRLRAA
jgi:hypothetical protein